MAVELRTAVEGRFGVNLPLFSLSEGLTLAALAARLVDPVLGEKAAMNSAMAGETSLSGALALAMARHETAAIAGEEEMLPLRTSRAASEVATRSAVSA